MGEVKRGQKGSMVGEKDQFEKLVKIGQNGKKTLSNKNGNF